MADLQTVIDSVPFEQNEVLLDGSTVNPTSGMSYYAMSWMTAAANAIPPYWSIQRDVWLREFFTKSDPVKIAVNTFINKAVSIPFGIHARDASMRADTEYAASAQESMQTNSGLLAGFKNEFKKFIRDYLTQDNGAMMYVQGKGKTTGPIVGPAYGLYHMDAGRCQRTGDPEFPIIYLHTTGEKYPVHYTRVIMMANMPSPQAELFGVGMCAVSCVIDPSLEMQDIATYSAEKFGSRPPRQILYAKTGATIDQLNSAIRVFDERIRDEGLRRFSKTMTMAPKVANQTLELDILDMSSTPDGFDREKVTILNLALLAAAFGIDLRDLAVSFGVAGQTRADAEEQSKKGRGKGVHELLETFTERINLLYLPEFLQISFDTMDDDQDEQRAGIRNTKSQARERDLRAGVTSPRLEREKMLEDGEITEQQFKELELSDGRTPDGLDLLLLFNSKDAQTALLLGFLSDTDPTDVTKNDPAQMVAKIQERRVMAFDIIENTRNPRTAWRARMAMAALDKLQSMYQDPSALQISDQVMLDAVDAGASATAIAEDPTGAATGSTEATGDVADETGSEDAAEPAEELADKAAAKKKQLDTPGLDAVLADAIDQYRADFERLIAEAVQGDIVREEAERILGDIIGSILLLLFFRGSRLSQATTSAAEQAQILEIVRINMASLSSFLDDVYAGRYDPISGLGLTGAFNRIGVWENMAVVAYSTGQLNRRDDPYFRWMRNHFKDSCGSCIRLEGQVHTASEWLASGWMPRSGILECGGFNCGCGFVETTGPSHGGF